MDLACITHAVMLTLASCNAMAWFEYVPSKSNLADGGTRDSLDEAEALHFEFVEAMLPPWPSNLLSASPAVWMDWLKTKF